jgi:DNA-binding HxlR family transcriptional regulator
VPTQGPWEPRWWADRLEGLADDGLVDRIDEETPPRVEYALAEDGGSLLAALEDLVAWARKRES